MCKESLFISFAILHKWGGKESIRTLVIPLAFTNAVFLGAMLLFPFLGATAAFCDLIRERHRIYVRVFLVGICVYLPKERKANEEGMLMSVTSTKRKHFGAEYEINQRKKAVGIE